MIKSSRILLAIVCMFFISFAAQAQDYRTHKVQEGETLYSLAKYYGVAVDDLLKLNPDAQDGLAIGDLLILPLKEQVNDSAYVQYEV